MAIQEFLTANIVNTTTQIAVNSGTGTAAYLFNRNTRLGYVSSGYTGATSTTITLSFTSAVVISTIMLQNHNLKDFTIYRDGTTTTLTAVASNSATSTYLNFSSVTVSSLAFVITGAMTSAERRIGELIVTERKLQFERNPSINDFDPKLMRKQVIHEMPDGGITLFNIKDKYQAKIGWRFITSTFKDNLFTVFDAKLPLTFVPKPTTTGWDGFAYEVNWVGDFNFKPSTNVESSGYSGNFWIKQTPSQ